MALTKAQQAIRAAAIATHAPVAVVEAQKTFAAAYSEASEKMGNVWVFGGVRYTISLVRESRNGRNAIKPLFYVGDKKVTREQFAAELAK